MVNLRERIDTPEALMAAIDGYQHLPVETLSQFLRDNYTVDLDVLAQFAEALEASSSRVPRDTVAADETPETAQSAA